MTRSKTHKHQSVQIEAQSTVRNKGQITVPYGVRKTLGLKLGDHVAFIVNENKKIEVIKKPSVVARTAGVLKGIKPDFSAEELRIEAESAIAEEAIKRSKQ